MIKNLRTTLFEQGKIKIGGKGKEKISSGGKKYQEALKLDHFIITTLERDTTPEQNFKIDSAAMAGLPKNPTTLPVEFLYDDIDLNFPTCFAMFGKDGLFCRGDGETAQRGGKEIVCDRETCQYSLSGGCKISGILLCRLPHLDNLMGVYKFRTHSWNSVKNILAALQYVQTLTGGIVAGLPFELRLEKKPTKFGVVKIVNLVFSGGKEALAEELEKEVARREKLHYDIHRVEEAAVLSGVTKDTDDPQDVAAEFFPGQGESDPESPPQPPQRTKTEQLKALYDAIETLTQDRAPQHIDASLNLHLNVETLRDCTDVHQLFKYYEHVVNTMEEEFRDPITAGLFRAECESKNFQKAIALYRKEKAAQAKAKAEAKAAKKSQTEDQLDIDGMLATVEEYLPERLDDFVAAADTENYKLCQELFDAAQARGQGGDV